MRILCLVYLGAWSMFEGQYDIDVSDARCVWNIRHIMLFPLKLESCIVSDWILEESDVNRAKGKGTFVSQTVCSRECSVAAGFVTVNSRTKVPL